MPTDPRDAQIAVLRELCKLPQPNTHQVNREMATGLRWALDERDELQAENARLREALRHFIDHTRGVERYELDDLIWQAELALAAAPAAKQEPECKL